MVMMVAKVGEKVTMAVMVIENDHVIKSINNGDNV